MRNYIILTLLVTSKLFSQIPIIDAQSHEKIPFVEIYNSKGDIIGVTDVEGLIGKELLGVIKENNTVSFNHLSYKENILAVKDIINMQEIKLMPETNLLQEVTLIGKKRKIKTYIKLKGYYRNYQTNDSVVKYYTDGVIEYYIPLDDKNKIWNRRIQERSFINKELEDKEKERFKTVVLNTAGPPHPDKRLTKPFLENEGYTFMLENGNTTSILSNGIKKGIVSKNPENKATSLQIQLISKDNPKEYKGFGYNSIIENNLGFAVYNTLSSDSLNNRNTIYHREIRQLRFKHKKDNEFQYIESIDEFFVTEIEILSKFKKSLYSKWFGFNRNSDYVTEYWEEFKKHPFYKPLPSGVEWALHNKLTKLDNIQKISKIFLEMGLIKE
jgi:hypothetical protein